uniref:Uncharacterized protein n=1 Tax=Amphimedon queenslandica TaxID=400682 RepID=A0A1X7T9B3_AMPQE
AAVVPLGSPSSGSVADRAEESHLLCLQSSKFPSVQSFLWSVISTVSIICTIVMFVQNSLRYDMLQERQGKQPLLRKSTSISLCVICNANLHGSFNWSKIDHDFLKKPSMREIHFRLNVVISDIHSGYIKHICYPSTISHII